MQKKQKKKKKDRNNMFNVISIILYIRNIILMLTIVYNISHEY
jgi:hypothetical protein